MSRPVHYRVIRKLAKGGMAEIFLALQIGAEGFQKPVVLKRILPALAADPAFVRMLVDEAHIASILNHSNLVQVLDLGKSGDQFFLVLEFVDGWSLEQVRRRAQKARLKLPLPLILYIVSALCRALAYVHKRARDGKSLGIVHRDVTPQNVLLSREGEVKLADFGIAKAVGRREKSSTGVIKGKFAYMSPEQSIGGELDARSDLFSVGTVLYVLTTGKKPFDGPTDLDVLMQVRKARYEKPSELVRDFNPDVERFIARALRPDLSRRWQNADQMADRLDAILVKLGQPSGSAALKRWLDTLSLRDGILPPGELGEATTEEPTGTIELQSRDLELQDVSPPASVVGSAPADAGPGPAAPVAAPPPEIAPVDVAAGAAARAAEPAGHSLVSDIAALADLAEPRQPVAGISAVSAVSAVSAFSSGSEDSAPNGPAVPEIAPEVPTSDPYDVLVAQEHETALDSSPHGRPHQNGAAGAGAGVARAGVPGGPMPLVAAEVMPPPALRFPVGSPAAGARGGGDLASEVSTRPETIRALMRRHADPEDEKLEAPATAAEQKRPVERAEPNGDGRAQEGAPQTAAERAAEPSSEPSPDRSSDQFCEPSPESSPELSPGPLVSRSRSGSRAIRWLARATVATVLTFSVLGSGAYFARSYLPLWLARPVGAWLDRLPTWLDLGGGEQELPVPGRSVP